MMQTNIKFPVRKMMRAVRPTGRPKATAGVKLKHQICIHVDSETFAELSAVADQTEQSMAQTVRGLMMASLEAGR